MDGLIHFFPSLGVGTKIDPTLCRGDRMVGQVYFNLLLALIFQEIFCYMVIFYSTLFASYDQRVCFEILGYSFLKEFVES